MLQYIHHRSASHWHTCLAPYQLTSPSDCLPLIAADLYRFVFFCFPMQPCPQVLLLTMLMTTPTSLILFVYIYFSIPPTMNCLIVSAPLHSPLLPRRPLSSIDNIPSMPPRPLIRIVPNFFYFAQLLTSIDNPKYLVSFESFVAKMSKNKQSAIKNRKSPLFLVVSLQKQPPKSLIPDPCLLTPDP